MSARPAGTGPRAGILTGTLVVLSVVLLLPLIAPVATGRVHVGDDLGNMHLPVRALYQAALRSGQPLLWTPYLYSGMYLHGEGQAGMYHPAHLLLYWLLPLPWAFALELAGSYVVMLPGMYLFLRRLALPAPAALFGAMVFTFSGFNLLHFMHLNAIAVVAHMPWILFGIDVLLRDPSPRRTIVAESLISLAVGSQLLLGHPQFVWLCAVGELAFAAWRLSTVPSWWRLGRLGGAMALGVLLGGIQLLPTMQMLAESERSHPTQAFLASYSLPLANLLQLISPYALRGRVVGGNVQEFGLYNGAVCSVAIGWLLLRHRALGRWRGVILAGVAFSATMLLLAIGPAGGLYRLLMLVPGIGVFRAPARYILLVHLVMATICAIMMADLLRLSRRIKRRPKLAHLGPLCFVAALSVLELAMHAVIETFGPAWLASYLWPMRISAIGTGLVLIASALVLAAFRGLRWAPWLLAVFTMADLALWGHSFVWREWPETPLQLGAKVPAPPGPPDGGRIHVTGNMDWLSGDVLVMHRYRLASGYVGLRPTRTLSAESEVGQRLLGVRWVFRDGHWAEVRDPLPRARLVAEAIVTSDVAKALPAIDVHRTALVRDDVGQLGPRSEGSAEVVRDEPGLIEVRTGTLDRQLLVVSEAYSNGWRASQDGRPSKLHRAYDDLLACTVDPGEHRIRLEFQPNSFTEGRRMSAVGAFLLSIWVSVSAARAFRRPEKYSVFETGAHR